MMDYPDTRFTTTPNVMTVLETRIMNSLMQDSFDGLGLV